MPEPQYYWGIVLAIIATLDFNIMAIVQKRALEKLDAIEVGNFFASLKLLIKDKEWLLSSILAMLGGIPYTIALEWTGVSIVQPLMSFGFIVLVIFAKKYLGEDLNFLAKFSILLMILMPVFIGAGNVSNSTKDITQWEAQFQMIIYLLAIFWAACVFYFFSKKFPVLIALVCSSLFAIGALLGQAAIAYISFLDLSLEENLFEVIEGVFTDPDLLPVLFLFLASLIANMLAGGLMQIGLQKIAASKFNPIQQTLNTLMTISGGIVIFGQNVGNWPFYILGMICAIIGTIVLSAYQMPEKFQQNLLEKTPETSSGSSVLFEEKNN